MPPQAASDLSSARPGLNSRPLWWLYACAVLIIAVLLGTDVAGSLRLREATLHNSEANLRNVSLALAEQADRAMQGVDLVLTSVADFVDAEGADNVPDFERKMAAQHVHEVLAGKLIGLPNINALTMIGPHGDLINFSRYWPIPQVNVADRDYFRAMQTDDTLQRFVSTPIRSRADGHWSIYLARRAPSRDGRFVGLLLGAIDLKYLEDFYRSVSLGDGTAISLVRMDGSLLARYPLAEGIAGKTLPLPGGHAPQAGVTETIRDVSPVDGALRIMAVRKLANYPLFVRVTQTEPTALAGWRSMVVMLGLVTAGFAGAILAATLAIGRWWRQQRFLYHARAEHAKAEHARVRAEADLALERERNAQEASRAKSGFLAMMSHEIRTPMNAVLGLAGSLLDAPLTQAQREVVSAIHDSGDSLLRILNDILDYSKLEAGRMTFEAAPFSPATLTQYAISILGPRARAKGLVIAAETDPALPSGLLGDAGRIRQVLLNLVSNAVKFTDAGFVTISACCAGREGDAATVEWSVQDTGIGIAPDRIGSLFGEFVQADSSISRRFGGSGLGLAISKRLTALMGGTIDVESVVGAGTTLRVRLTLPIAERPPEVQLAPTDPVRSLEALLATLGRPVRILFAEDNPTNQYVVQQMLKGLAVQVDVVGNGLEAVEAAARAAYDVIFMDMRMPEMDGQAAARLIRQRGGALEHVPIIALTANAFPEDVKACFDAGMNEFVTKPVGKDVLFGAILRSLSRQMRPAPPAPEPAVAEVPPAFDAAALHALGEDIGHDGVAEMLEVFQQETLVRLQRMTAAGIPSVSLMREAHTLKGAAGTVCAPLLRRRAEAIEARLRAGAPLEPGDLPGLAEAMQAFTAAVEATGIMSRVAA